MRTIGGILAIAAAIAFFAGFFRDWGYRSGVKDGLELGRKASDEWWITIGEQTQQAREKIWREET